MQEAVDTLIDNVLKLDFWRGGKAMSLRARNPGDRTRSFGCPREGRKTVFLYITPSNSISHFRVITG